MKSEEGLIKLFDEKKLNKSSEAVLIYMEGELGLESEIVLFDIEETGDCIYYEKNGIHFEQLFSLTFALELINDYRLIRKGYSDLQIAQRLVEYGINDA